VPERTVNLTDAWFAAGGVLRTIVPDARLSHDGLGIDLPRPATPFDLVAIRRWLAATMPRLRVRPGHDVRYDRPHQHRRG